VFSARSATGNLRAPLPELTLSPLVTIRQPSFPPFVVAFLSFFCLFSILGYIAVVPRRLKFENLISNFNVSHSRQSVPARHSFHWSPSDMFHSCRPSMVVVRALFETWTGGDLLASRNRCRMCFFCLRGSCSVSHFESQTATTRHYSPCLNRLVQKS
jgi:hypothetical protein